MEEFYQEQLRFMNEELRNKDNFINSLLHQLSKQTECIISLDNRFSNNVSCVYDHVRPTIREFYPKHIILHVGQMNLKVVRRLVRYQGQSLTLYCS